MKIIRNLSVSMVVILLTGLCGSAYAQTSDPASQQKQLQETMEMLKQQGMDPEQLKQLEQQLKTFQSMEQTRNENQEKAIQEKKQEEAIAKEEQRMQQIQSVTAEAGKINIGIGDERVQLDVESCSTSPQRTGNLLVLAKVFASGTFRGSPALVKLSKSHPVGNPNAQFQQMEFWLTERTSDETGMDVEQILAKRNQDFEAWYNAEQQQIMQEFQVDDDMSLDQMNAQMNAQQEAMSMLTKQAESRRLQRAISHGEVNVDGDILRFESPRLSPTNSGKIPDAFFDIENAQLYAVASCK